MTPNQNIGGGVVFALATLLLLVLAALTAYETYALFSGNVTITAITRGLIGHHHLIAMAIAAAVLILIGHFFS